MEYILPFTHAYFIPKWAQNEEGKIDWTKETLKEVFNYYVLPIIEEYSYGNQRYLRTILGNYLPNRINDTELFFNEIKERFTNK